ncbi:hypothetical protein [Kozakia baliensis]|nr:hypothetical protein [Kozakia baliensis]GEL65769.1 hypothetical protein KBA01_30550 [Kozakia baliensis]
MMTALEKLKNRMQNQIEPQQAGELFRWLVRHFTHIEELRAGRVTWREIAEAAEQDGIRIGVSRTDLRRLEKKWRLVRKARSSAELRRLEGERQNHVTRAATEGKQVMPSRLPANWRPQFVEPAQSTALQPATVNAGQGAVPTLKKNALATTNFRAVASSDAEMTPAILEGKTLADIAAEEIEREMRIMANRQAGYFGDK